MFSLCDRVMAGMERECEQALRDVQERIPWLNEGDVETLRLAFAVFVGWMTDEKVDFERMSGAFLALAERAEVEGDALRVWGFDQLSQWSCAVARGERYDVPAVPDVLVGLVERE